MAPDGRVRLPPCTRSKQLKFTYIMKEITGIKKVKITYNELINLNTIFTNRCGEITLEKAKEKGYSEMEFKTLETRAKKLVKIINAKGFSMASTFAVAIGKDGKYYILDGQGRRMALKMINDSGRDISAWEFNCDLYTEPMEFSDMSKLIRDYNTGNTNWKNSEIRRCDVLGSGNKEVLEAYNYVKKLKEDYGINDYMANLLTFGEKGSHQRSNGMNAFTPSDYSETKDLFTNAYLKLIVNASYAIDKDGNSVERSKAAQSAIRNTNLGIALVSLFRSIVDLHKNDEEINRDENIANDIDYVVEKILSTCCDGVDSYMRQNLKMSSKSANELWGKIRKNIGKKKLIELSYANCNA